MTTNEATNTKVFLLDYENETIFTNDYYSVIGDEVDPTWASKFRISEFNETKTDWFNNTLDSGFEVYEYNWHASPKWKTIRIFETEQQAEDFKFELMIEKFESSDNAPSIYYTEESAIESLLEYIAGENSIDIEVAESYLRHKKCAANIKADLEEKARQQNAIANEILLAEAEEEALEISTLIDKIEGEKYRETCKRLSIALGKKINTRVFHLAIKNVRK